MTIPRSRGPLKLPLSVRNEYSSVICDAAGEALWEEQEPNLSPDQARWIARAVNVYESLVDLLEGVAATVSVLLDGVPHPEPRGSHQHDACIVCAATLVLRSADKAVAAEKR